VVRNVREEYQTMKNFTAIWETESTGNDTANDTGSKGNKKSLLRQVNKMRVILVLPIKIVLR